MSKTFVDQNILLGEKLQNILFVHFTPKKLQFLKEILSKTMALLMAIDETAK